MVAAANREATADEQGLRILTKQVQAQLDGCVRGKGKVVARCIIGVLARGHILLEDQPGVGKTTLAKALAKSFGLDFSRLQFTADLLPSDVVGMSIWSPKSEEFILHRGPVFSQMLLADEINRSPARTQSALLQAMAEKKVSIEGRELALFPGFCVVATQNPSDHGGTYPLPHSQRDRFSLRLSMGYPDPRSEQEIYCGESPKPDELKPLLCPKTSTEIQDFVSLVHLHPSLAGYVQRFAGATRCSPVIETGLSVRACLSWIQCARARAWLAGRSEILPDDLQDLALDCLAHRLRIRDCQLSAQQSHGEDLIHDLLAETALP